MRFFATCRACGVWGVCFMYSYTNIHTYLSASGHHISLFATSRACVWRWLMFSRTYIQLQTKLMGCWASDLQSPTTMRTCGPPLWKYMFFSEETGAAVVHTYAKQVGCLLDPTPRDAKGTKGFSLVRQHTAIDYLHRDIIRDSSLSLSVPCLPVSKNSARTES